MSQDIKDLKARAEALFRAPRDESRRHLGEYEADLAEKTMRLRALRLAKEAAQLKGPDESTGAVIKGK